jgi:hypothetical protein
MCTPGATRPNPYCRVNQLLGEYAALPFNPATCHAHDPAHERRILDDVEARLSADVRDLIRQQLHLPRVTWTVPGANDRERREQRADDAYQDFWVVFLASLRTRRCEGRDPVVIDGRAYLRWWVVRVLRWRGLRPFEELNAQIVEYWTPGGYRDRLRFFIERAILRCCCAALGITRRQWDQLGPADRAPIEEATRVLLRRFLAGEIWQTPVVDQPLRVAQADDLMAAGVRPVPRRTPPVTYVTAASFRQEAGPLLLEAPGPPSRGPSPTSEPPAGDRPPAADPATWTGRDRFTLLDRITRECADLVRIGGRQSRQNLRYLAFLSFRPYFKPADAFHREFTENGFPFSNGDVTKALQFWVGQCLSGQQETIRALRDDVFPSLLRSLVEFRGLVCTPAAQRALPDDPAWGRRVLADFWLLAIGHRRTSPGKWGRFLATEQKDPGSVDVTDFDPSDTRDYLILDVRPEGTAP